MSKSMEIDQLFAQEVRTHQETIRRQAVLAVLARRQVTENMTVQEFMSGLRDSKDVWTVVANMGIVPFADCLGNAQRLREENARLRAENDQLRHHTAGSPAMRVRTRLSNVQKEILKKEIVRLLQEHDDGLARLEVAALLPDTCLAQLRLSRRALPSKLRIPFLELLQDGRMVTHGEKRFMRYFLSAQAEKPASAIVC